MERSVTPAVEIEHLHKSYGAFTALADISLRVRDGDFFGFLGPNGAGKTTTINAIVGLVKLGGGSIRVFGHDIIHDWRAARACIGLAPQEYNFDRYLSIRDVLIFQAGYFGLRPRAVAARADALLERFGLASKARTEYVKLSGGMKRRLSLARALIHQPRLLILDEPTAGVDIELRIELWEMLRGLNAEGTTIFLTTHYLEEAEKLCRTIGIIDRGKLVALEPTDSLLQRRPQVALVLTPRDRIGRLPPELRERGAQLENDGNILFPGCTTDRIAEVLAAVRTAGIEIRDVDFQRATLQDVFLELTSK